MKLTVTKKCEFGSNKREWNIPYGAEEKEFDCYLDVMVWIEEDIKLCGYDLWFKYDESEDVLHCISRNTNQAWIYKLS